MTRFFLVVFLFLSLSPKPTSAADKPTGPTVTCGFVGCLSHSETHLSILLHLHLCEVWPLEDSDGCFRKVTMVPSGRKEEINWKEEDACSGLSQGRDASLGGY